MALLLKPQFSNDFSPILSQTKIILEPISLLKQVFLNFEFSRQNIFEPLFSIQSVCKTYSKKSVHFRERDGDPTKKRDFLLQSSITSRERRKKKFLTSLIYYSFSLERQFSESSKSRIDYSLEQIPRRMWGLASISFHWHSTRSILVG